MEGGDDEGRSDESGVVGVEDVVVLVGVEGGASLAAVTVLATDGETEDFGK